MHGNISGLHYRGAAEGEGLGNAFLSNIAAVDGIFHVCRAFEDPDVVHVEDRVDPVADLEIIHGSVCTHLELLPRHPSLPFCMWSKVATVIWL